MARLQILELPEGADDARAPFVVVLDQVEQSSAFDSVAARRQLDESARAWGASGTLVAADTIEIPANDVPIGPDGYPVRFKVEADVAGFGEDVAAAICRARAEADRATEGGHLFGGPGFEDPMRCQRCGTDRTAWAVLRNAPTCASVQARGGV
ncbi:hypothetical protein AAIB46_10230 [Streptomyces sp. 35M1]|uniref:hypothetical protein n=1 Tax=Streptomyces sp. 35M1 TaxID=3142978 RepID=UPI003990A3C5